MSRTNANITILPPSVERQANKIVPVAALKTNLKLLKKLNEKEQKFIISEAQEISGGLLMEGLGRLSVGQHLMRVHEVLAPKGLFASFLRAFPRIKSKMQAKRYMDGYLIASEKLPPTILAAAQARGLELIGIKDPKKYPLGQFTDAYRRLGAPPRNADPAVANKYLDELVSTAKEIRIKQRKSAAKRADQPQAVEHMDADDRKKHLLRSYRLAVSGMVRMTPKQREAFWESLSGMLLAELGVSHKSVNAEAAPDEFKPKPVGRPKDPNKAPVQPEVVAATA